MRKISIVIMAALALVLLNACHSENDGHDHGHGEEGHSHGDEVSATESATAHVEDEIIFTPAQAEAAGLETEPLTARPFHQIIKTSGQIISARGDEQTVVASSSGIIQFEQKSINEGLAVCRGDELLNISSRKIEDGDPIQKARVAFEVAKKEYERAQKLREEKLISEKEFNEIFLNYENARLSFASFSSQRHDNGVDIDAPIDGYLNVIYVREGEYVNAGQPLFTITQNKRLQLRADVSERYYDQLGTIQSANFRSPYQDKIIKLADLNGRMVSYGRATSEQAFTIPVNFEFDNIGRIASGAYVEIYLIGAERPNTVTVPISALTESNGLFFVYKKIGDDAYLRQEVKLGDSDGDRVEVLRGVASGDVIVTKGAYQVKLAAASTSIPHGHSH